MLFRFLAAICRIKDDSAISPGWVILIALGSPTLSTLSDSGMRTGTCRVDGTVQDKAAFLAEAKNSKYTAVDYSDEKVAVFGHTAVASGKSHLKGNASSGEKFEIESHYTDVWVKMPNGRWQCVSSQDSGTGH